MGINCMSLAVWLGDRKCSAAVVGLDLVLGLIIVRPQCIILIVPEEGWFGQPKYSTPSKTHSTLYRFLPSYSKLETFVWTFLRLF